MRRVEIPLETCFGGVDIVDAEAEGVEEFALGAGAEVVV